MKRSSPSFNRSSRSMNTRKGCSKKRLNRLSRKCCRNNKKLLIWSNSSKNNIKKAKRWKRMSWKWRKFFRKITSKWKKWNKSWNLQGESSENTRKMPSWRYYRLRRNWIRLLRKWRKSTGNCRRWHKSTWVSSKRKKSSRRMFNCTRTSPMPRKSSYKA